MSYTKNRQITEAQILPSQQDPETVTLQASQKAHRRLLDQLQAKREAKKQPSEQ